VIPVRILVVDDHPENRTALRAILSAPDYQIVEAGSGAEALFRLLEGDFAVLLIDVVMPDMSGFELAAAIKEREKTAAIPIVFLTAQATDVDLVFKGYEVGAVDYLMKPLVPEMIRAKVAVFAQLFRERTRNEQQAVRLLEAERNENELRLIELRLANERHYRTLAQAVPHIVWTARGDGAVDYFNQRWFEYTGLSVEQAAGSWFGIVHPDDVARCQTDWENAMRSGEMFRTECRLQASDGTFLWHVCRAVPERSTTGQILSWVGTFTDIEDQKRALRARDEFLSVASHELRTPLATLQLEIQMLLKPSRRLPQAVLSPEQITAKLEMASRQVERLTRLIAELMDVSRITAGRLELELEEIDLSALVRDVVGRLDEEATRTHSHVEIRASLPVIGMWDRTRVEQIVTNLLTNAFKFGGGKPIEITVEESGPIGRVVVVDHGIGIAPEDVERIFQRYEQAVSSRTFGGLGLGLYIARQIIESHGGTIRVESQPGTGSTFTVDLPKRGTPTQKGVPWREPALTGSTS